MFLFCLVFAMFCARLFICALWSPAGKGLTSWLSFVVSSVSLSLSHWYPGSGVVLDCIDSWSLQPYYFTYVGKLWFALSRLRLSSHRLEVETGRLAWPNAIPFEESTSCHSLEDEFQFVLECSRYNELRTTYIPNYYRSPNMFKLVELFKSENNKTQINLSLYVFKAFKTMEQFVFG